MPTPEPTSASRLLRAAVPRLSAIGAGNPRLEAEYLLAAALACGRTALLRRGDAEPIPGTMVERFDLLLRRREAREPLQYILGTIPFCEIDLAIGPGALIPRGETEILVEEVGRRLAESLSPRAGGEPPLLIDVGTGSGAILLALLHRLPGWRGIGVDRSAEALRWARKNGDRWEGARQAERTSGEEQGQESQPEQAPQHGPAEAHEPADDAISPRRLLLLRADLLSAIRTASAIAIISNPPYIRSAEIPELAPEIREHEPIEALDGGPDGLDAVRHLAPEAARVLCPGGLLALELAPDQPEAAAGVLASTGAFETAAIFRDLAGRKRGILSRRTGPIDPLRS